MTENKTNPYPPANIDELPDDIAKIILEVQEKSGFIPNIFMILARRPDEFRAFFAYHNALMEKDCNLTKAEREMIVVTTSNFNQCQYCVVAHGAILRIRAKDAYIADQVAVNYRKADITARQRAMLDYAIKVSQNAYEINTSDSKILHHHGFNDEDIWDIAAISAFFGMSNRIANALSISANKEFYNMGRDL